MQTYKVVSHDIPLGHRWEHYARRIEFDISAWVDAFGPGTLQLLHQRQGDEYPYPVTVTRTDADGETVNDTTGTLVRWDVTNTDTAQVCRYGKAELRYYRGTQVAPEFLAKSDLYRTTVENALGGALATAPEESPDWLATLLSSASGIDDQVEAARGYAEDAAQSATDAASSANFAQGQAEIARTSTGNAVTNANLAMSYANEAKHHKNVIANMGVSAQSLPASSEATVSATHMAEGSNDEYLEMQFGIPRGATGYTFTPSVAANGDLSWTNDGGLQNPATVNIRGPQGDAATINGVNALTIDAGENITATQDGDTLHISATDTVYDTATASSAGLMSAADKAKLDGIPADATSNTGTITEIRMNGAPVSVGGVADLGTIITDVSGKLDASRVGTANGVAELDANGIIITSQLPSYVDDVLEYAAVADFPATGESGKIYVATSTNLTYRWTGTGYAEISPSIALGETSATAYRGDRGKIAYDHSQATGNAHSMTKADIGLGNVDNTSDANKPISTAQQAALNLKVDKVTGKGLSTEDYTTAEKNKLSGIESGANATTIDATLSNSGQAADAKATGDNLAALRAENALLRELVNGIDAPIYRTAPEGNPVTFDDGYPANVRNLVVTLTPTQSGSGDPSPDNIRPISGATSVSVAAHNAPSNVVTITPTQSGSGNPSPTNIRPISGVDCGQAGTVYGGTLDVATGTLTVNAIKIAVSENWGYSTEDGRYFSDALKNYGLKSGNDNQLRGALCSHFKEAQQWQVTASANTFAIRSYVNTDFFYLPWSVTEGNNDVAALRAWIVQQREAGTPVEVVCPLATPVTYQLTPAETKSVLNQLGYDGNRLTVSLVDSNDDPLTVYGGTLDVTSGTLTVNTKFMTFTGVGDEFANNYPGGNGLRVFALPADAWPVADNDATGDILCSHAPTVSANALWNSAHAAVAISAANSTGRVQIDGVRNLDEMRAWMSAQNSAGIPLQILYRLATPVTYQLTAAQIATLSGYNAVSADTGTLSVTYRADTALSLS